LILSPRLGSRPRSLKRSRRLSCRCRCQPAGRCRGRRDRSLVRARGRTSRRSADAARGR
jgi:hypothetical protein